MKQISYLPTTISLLFLFLLGMTESAWALQSHGSPEGLYVHQMAHLLFAATLAYLFWHTRRTPAVVSKGWKYLQIFCVLLACWNLLAFAGHEAFEHLAVTDFLDKDSWREQLAAPIGPLKALYFVTKMDHFLIVPALLALVISLRTFYREACEGARK
jgi:hypothetical protein